MPSKSKSASKSTAGSGSAAALGSLFELDDLLYALENAAEFLENEEWSEPADKARQEAANREGAKRIRRMVKRLNKANDPS